jgi:hypothetical protein
VRPPGATVSGGCLDAASIVTTAATVTTAVIPAEERMVS